MATREELIEALRAADAAASAGDAEAAEDARRLAEALHRMGQAQGQQPAPVERSEIVQQEFNEAPWYQQAATAADDTVRLLADGLTFGFADKLAAYLDSKTGAADTYEDALQQQRTSTADAMDRAGLAGTTAQILGGLGTGLAASRSGLYLAGRGVQASQPWLARTAITAAGAVPEAAAYGALDAAGHDEDIGQGALWGAIAGGALSPVAEGVTSVAGKIAQKARGTNVAPSLDELKARKQAAYRASEDIDARFNPEYMQGMVREIQEKTTGAKFGAREMTTPNTVQTVDDLVEALGPGNKERTSLYDLDKWRQRVWDRTSHNPEEARFGAMIREIMDNRIAGATPADVVTAKGTPQDAANAILSARDAARREAKVNRLTELMTKAERDVRAKKTDASSGEEIKYKVRTLLNGPEARDFTQAERARLDSVITGTKAENLWRKIGNYSGSMSGRATGAGLGLLVGQALDPTGGLIGTSGAAIGGVILPDVVKRAAWDRAETLVSNNMRDIIDEIARGRPALPSRAEPGLPRNDDVIRFLQQMVLQAQERQANPLPN